MSVSKHQVSSVIAAYMKNLRTRAGIDGSIKHDSAGTELTISKEAFENTMFDRITQQIRRKLKKG